LEVGDNVVRFVGSIGDIGLIGSIECGAPMATIRRFEDLECWQEARAFARLVYHLTKKEGFRTDFELIGQVKRSAISSMSNIAEGFHRNSKKDFMRFLDYSRGSIAETLSHCHVALDQG
jgi:four helix bundle protein